MSALDLGLEPEEAVAFAATRDMMTNSIVQTTRELPDEVTDEEEPTKH